MSIENLSPNDIDALLGTRSGAPESAAVAPRRGQEPVLYDFRRPHRVSKERLRTLEAMYERMVKSLEGWMLGRARGGVEFTLHSVEQMSFSEFALSLQTPCCAYLLEIHDSGGQQCVVDFGQDFASFIVERFLGGRGGGSVLTRALTPIEQMVVRTVADRASAALEEIWSDYVSLRLDAGSFESVPEILRATTNGNDPVLVASVRVEAGGKSSFMSLSLPFTVLDGFFADNGFKRQSFTGSLQERQSTMRLTESSLLQTSVEVTARLPEFRVPMRTLTQLQAGMVIETGIPAVAPVDVRVNGDSSFRAAGARVGKRLAVKIEETLMREPGLSHESMNRTESQEIEHA